MRKITDNSTPTVENPAGFCTPTLFNLSDFNRKKVEVRFNFEQPSNDGGLLLLNEVEN